MTPAYPQVPLVKALRSPLMLILIGGLFALDHLTEYSIGRTWPLVLIVYGALLLLGRVGGGQPGPQAPMGPPGPPAVRGPQ